MNCDIVTALALVAGTAKDEGKPNLSLVCLKAATLIHLLREAATKVIEHHDAGQLSVAGDSDSINKLREAVERWK